MPIPNLRVSFLRLAAVSLSAVVLPLSGCESNDEPADDLAEPAAVHPDDQAPSLPVAPARPADEITVDELRSRLGANRNAQFRKAGGKIVIADLSDSGVTDLGPLEGLPLVALGLNNLKISALSPLAGMPLERLYLAETNVTDLSPLKGMSLSELNAIDTPLTDISPLAEIEVGTLWIRDTQVSDLSPLASNGMVSLDIQGTPVGDLAPLAGNHDLRRLNIADTKVADLSPLKDLRLERLTFTPSNITDGIEAIRSMASLEQLAVQFETAEDAIPADLFWEQYDAGAFAE